MLAAIPAMARPPLFQPDLIERYDRPGPRYTSYPPATEFHDRVGEREYREWARQSNEELIPKPLSLYFHIPFCSSICYYCACNKVITRRREKAEPYLEDLFREIELQAALYDRDREVRQLHWGGGTPGFLSHVQSQALMERIAASFRLVDAGAHDYSIEIDPRVMAADGIAHLRCLGFNRVSLGVQDFDPRVQRAVNRIQSYETTARIVADARRHGMRSVNIDLIYGLPLQTRASFAATLERVVELDPDRIAIYNYAHLPHRFPPQRRIDTEALPVPAEKLAILRDAIERLDAAGYDYIGMDHFARPRDELARAQRRGDLHRNFQGYSAHAECDSIGLGVSAISQVADNFSQNSIGLDDYHAALAAGRLPIARGYRSDPDDLLRRAIIQSLVCHFRVDIRRVEADWAIDFGAIFATELAELRAMEIDGLLAIDDDRIEVADSGRLLIRNVCMVFDRYRRKARVEPMFSRTL